MDCNFDARVCYLMAHDSSTLWLCVVVLSGKSQQEVIHHGISLGFDPAGKKRPSCSLLIRPGVPDAPDPRQGNPGSRKTPPKSFPCDVRTTGFRTGPDGGTGIEAMMAFDSAGGLVVEAAVPIAAFPSDPRLAECLSLSFEITESGSGGGPGAPPPGQGGSPDDRPSGNRTGGGPGGGMEGGMGGGQGMGGSGRGGGQGMGGGPGSGGGPGGPGPEAQAKSYKIFYRYSVSPQK